jgi:hypothetical protein
MPVKPHTHEWHKFAKGARVTDTVSGEDGTVTHTHFIHGIEPAAAKGEAGETAGLPPLPTPVVSESTVVLLDNGETVTRSPRLLVAI